MQITHIAGVDLAANGWQLVADPMFAGNAGDNWQQTELGLLNDYPRPFQLTVRTQNTSRHTITQRVRDLLHALNNRNYHYLSYVVLRMQVVYNSVAYFVLFEPHDVQAGVLQWTGAQYVQSITISGLVIYPPYRQIAQQLTISSLTAYNVLSYSLGTANTYWSPASLSLVALNIGIVGGVWIGMTETGYPDSVIALSIPNSTPSSTAITIGTVTARQMASVGTYTYTMTWGIANRTLDYWLHVSGSATITIHVGSDVIAAIATNPNQLCYYAGRFQNEFDVTITVVTAAPNVIIYPIIRSYPNLSTCVIYTSGKSIAANGITWGNIATPTGATYIKTTANRFLSLAGAISCLAPRAGRIIATWSNHATSMTGNLYRFEIEQGLL